MKTKFLVGLKALALVLVSTTAFAQGQENQALIQVVNDPVPVQAVQAVPVQQAQPQQVIVQPQAQPVLMQQPTIYVQKQATTVVEDSPLTESAAEKLRKQRVEMEQQTESKIVQKLEEERMKAEQERAQKLMGNLEEKKEVPAVVAAPVVVAPQEQVQVVQPIVPVVKEVNVEQLNVGPAIEVKSELAALDEKREDDTRYYLTFDTGFISYDARNVETGVGFGANFGAVFDKRYIVEGNFMFVRADIESVTQPMVVTPTGVYPTIIQMDQYNFGGTFKWRILDSRFSPYVGGSLSYTYRNYEDEQSFYYYGMNPLEASSWAVDMGLLVGADIKLSDNFAIGTEFKYMFNVAYDVETASGYQQSKLLYPSFYANPVEELGYYSLAISLKYLF